MKTNGYLWIVIAGLMLGFISCRNYKLQTLVHADGQITRVFTIQSTDEIKSYNDFPFPVDSSWQVDITANRKADEMHDFTYMFTRKFESSKDIMSDYENIKHSFSDYDRSIELKKHYRLFYTDYQITERIHKKASGKHVNLNTWLEHRNPDLIRPETGDSSAISAYRDELDSLRGIWLDSLLLDEFLVALEGDLRDIGAATIAEKLQKSSQDSLRRAAEYIFDMENSKAFYLYCDSLYATDVFSSFIDNPDTRVQKLFEDIDRYFLLVEVDYSLQMPGALKSCNSLETFHDTMHWNISGIEAYLVGIQIYAESRIVHKATIIVTGLLFLALIIIIIRRRN